MSYVGEEGGEGSDEGGHRVGQSLSVSPLQRGELTLVPQRGRKAREVDMRL